MANKMKVEELRSELSKRGLNISGTKPILIKRLESALEEEKKTIKEECDASAGKKRQNESMADGSMSSLSKKIKTTSEDLRLMGIRQLREEAILRGVSVNGSKKELLQKLMADSEKGKEEDGENESKQEKEVSAAKKGTAELDEYLPDHIKADYHVLEHEGEFYDAMLNQTNVGDNNNKFYMIQVLEASNGGQFMVYTRWGRVGIRGQDKLQGPYASLETATQEFFSKFHSKTKNHWAKKKEFVSYPKYYTWLELDYTRDQQQPKVEDKAISPLEDPLQTTKLDHRIAKFISLIFSIGMMEQQMLVLGFNSKKLPLGKLSKSTILKGYNVLKKIADVIDQSNRPKLEELSGEFYTIIPHDFGFRNMRDCIIDTPLKLKAKLEMVEALGEIEAATSLLIKDGVDAKEDILFSNYQCLGCDLTPVEIDSEEFSLIRSYIKSTGTRYIVNIIQIFRASRKGEKERFKKFSQTKNRMLLWHGSRLSNWAGILSQGLRIAPPEAPVNGYAFGKGIYFADMFNKSAGYCGSLNNTVLVLCEVALGEINELHACNHNAKTLLNGKLSTKGLGGIEPDPSEARVLEDGVVVPLGNPKEVPERKGACWENEYIVYNADQVQIRYVLNVNLRYAS